jgi:hypothetical protein
MYEYRGVRRMGAVTIDIQQIPHASVSITNIGYAFDIPAPDKKRPQ